MGMGAAFYLPCGTGKGTGFGSQTGLGLNLECHWFDLKVLIFIMVIRRPSS